MITQVEIGIESGNLIVELQDPEIDEESAMDQAILILEEQLTRAKLRQSY